MERQQQQVAPVAEEQLDIEDSMKHCFENLIVIDVGANLTNKKYSRDLDSVVQRARDAGSLIKIFNFNNEHNRVRQTVIESAHIRIEEGQSDDRR